MSMNDNLEPVDAIPTDTIPAPAAPGEEAFDWEAFWDTHINGHAGDDETTVVEDDETDDETEQPPAPPGAAVEEEPHVPAGPPTVTEDEYLDIGDARIPANEAANVAQLYRWMREFPGQAAQFAEYLAGNYQIVPTEQVTQVQPGAPIPEPTPQTAPVGPADGESDDDWVFVPDSLRTRIAEMETHLQQQQAILAQQYAAQQAALEQQQIAALSSAIDTAVSTFQQRYELDDESTLALKTRAGQLGLAGRLAEQYGDPVRGVFEAMEFVYNADPAFRDRETARQIEEQTAAAERQRKLASLSGGSGTAPRVSPTPSTPEARREAMIDEIRAQLAQGS